MKRLIALSMAMSFLGISMAFADSAKIEDGNADLESRTVRSRQADSTGSPGYADDHLRGDFDEVEKEEAAEAVESEEIIIDDSYDDSDFKTEELEVDEFE